MKKYCWCFLLAIIICLTCSTARAQESVGFSEPEDIQSLVEYRLPDWGYSNFWMDLNYRGVLSDNKNESEYGELQETSSTNDLTLNPHYNLYRESEARKFELNSSLYLNFQDRDQKWEGIYDSSENPRNRLETRVQADFLHRKYFSDDLFLHGSGDFSARLIRRHGDQFEEGEKISERRRFVHALEARPEIGIGFGRIRNVTPIIRAVRLDERLRSLQQGSGLTRQQLLNGAEQFTRFNGYQRRYDRSQKYFWRDMSTATGGSLSGLDTFDTMYLTDVLDENLGSRLEGWEVWGGARFSYSSNLERVEETENQIELLDRSRNISQTLHTFTRGRWYKNLSLSHQIGMFGYASYAKPLQNTNTSSIEQNWTITARVGINWLWSVADRWLLRTGLSNEYRLFDQMHNPNNNESEKRRNWTDHIFLNNDLSYFVLNKVAINVYLNSQLRYNRSRFGNSPVDKKREFYLNYGISMRYYFSRNLY